MLLHIIKATRTDQYVTIRDDEGRVAELRVWHLRELIVEEYETNEERKAA